MKAIHPALLRRKPIVVTHQGCYSDPNLPPTLAARVKRFVSRWTTNITCSRAVADYLGAPATVIPNPYDDSTFKLIPDESRTKPLLFVGRLVSVKGIDLIVRALAILKKRGKTPPLTIAGHGPEEEVIKKLADELGVADQVTFLGPVTGEPLARLMNQHRIMLVPSRWEPFGIVALEGIACGCWVIGADDGGLRDAIGPCGEIFATENHEALANAMQRALDRPESEAPIDEATRSQHLSEHTARAVALPYLAVLEKAAGRKAN